jgi:hypothetical protein
MVFAATAHFAFRRYFIFITDFHLRRRLPLLMPMMPMLAQPTVRR